MCALSSLRSVARRLVVGSFPEQGASCARALVSEPPRHAQAHQVDLRRPGRAGGGQVDAGGQGDSGEIYRMPRCSFVRLARVLDALRILCKQKMSKYTYVFFSSLLFIINSKRNVGGVCDLPHELPFIGPTFPVVFSLALYPLLLMKWLGYEARHSASLIMPGFN